MARRCHLLQLPPTSQDQLRTRKQTLLPNAELHEKGEELPGTPSDYGSVFGTSEIPTLGSGEGLSCEE